MVGVKMGPLSVTPINEIFSIYLLLASGRSFTPYCKFCSLNQTLNILVKYGLITMCKYVCGISSSNVSGDSIVLASQHGAAVLFKFQNVLCSDDGCQALLSAPHGCLRVGRSNEIPKDSHPSLAPLNLSQAIIHRHSSRTDQTYPTVAM